MNVRWSAWIASVIVSTSVGFASSPLSAQSDDKPFIADNPVLKASVDRLSAGSAAWRGAVDAVRNTGRRVIIVTPNQVRMIEEGNGEPKPFDESVLAEVQPIADASQRVEVVVVVINLTRLEDLQRRAATVSDFESDLDRILAHEVYGHAVPYLLAGHLSGKCADPVAGQRASDACAIQRENEVRGQLGLGRRTEYGLHGLSMVRRLRH